MGVKVILTADNHLNNYYARMSPVRLEARRAIIRQAFQQTIEFSLERQVDLFLHAGDLFDMPEPRNTELIFVAKEFQRLLKENIQIFLIGGTHDVPKTRTFAKEGIPQRIFHEVEQAHLLYETNQIQTIKTKIKDLDVNVGGLSYNPKLIKGDDPLSNLTFSTIGDINILLLHYGIENHMPPDINEPLLRYDTLSQLSGVNYIFVGHQHKTEVFEIGDKQVIIPGATERMSFGEMSNPTGFYYLELDKGGLANLEYIKLEPQPMNEFKISLTTFPSSGDPTPYIIERLSHVCHPDSILKCSLIGVINREMYHTLRPYEISQFGHNHNFHFDLDTKELIIEDDIIKTISTGSISSKDEINLVAGVMSEEAEEEEKRLIQEAKNLIFSAL
ncbi:MAG: DNA repair exonuclease [bacterium]|nr:DNA repair exonuclease [bacterium]